MPRALRRFANVTPLVYTGVVPEGEVAVSNLLMTPAEVAALFAVNPKTIARWAKEGHLSAQRTMGGHRRYLRSEVNALLEGNVSAGR